MDGRVRRQSESGGSVDLLSFIQGLTSNSALLKIFFCSSDQVFGIINFSNISSVSFGAMHLLGGLVVVAVY